MTSASETLSSIKADLNRARAGSSGNPERLCEHLEQVIGSLCGFKQDFVSACPPGFTEVDAIAFDAIVEDLFNEWTGLVKEQQGLASEAYAAAVAAWYQYAPEGKSDRLVEALAASSDWTEAHWQGAHLLGLIEENLRFCVAVFFKAQEEGRHDIEESCRARLMAESDAFLTEILPGGIRDDFSDMVESKVLVVPTWED